MKLHSMRILGFQSFNDSGEIKFTDGINLIVGQNNAGKSALLRALQPDLADDRHRTPERWEDSQLPMPHVQLVIDVSGSELRDQILRTGSSTMPVPDGEVYAVYATNMLERMLLRMHIDHYPGVVFSSSYPSHRDFQHNPNLQEICIQLHARGGKVEPGSIQNGGDGLPSIVYQLWQRIMFSFSAERMNVGRSSFIHSSRLSPNAANLPSVLQTLGGERGDVFHRLVAHLREIFPTVGNVSVRPTPQGESEVRIWPTESMERMELSFPLLQSGTGVAQVIAILLAVMTVENAIIIIDEINSFLHPAAVKALLRVLQTDYLHHQYIISTHAPEVIGFSNPKTLIMIKRLGYESSVTSIEMDKVDAFREVADHLGVSMADVFAADQVVWVEGPTEELCFPYIYSIADGEALPRGTAFTSVMATGDFMTKRREKELIYQIYRRLTEAAVPLVVSAAFSFDSETLSDADKEQMQRDSDGKLHFLPRRHIECYLIDPESIATFVRDKELEPTDEPAVQQVAACLKSLAASEHFKIPEWSGDINDAVWQSRVDAAKLIAETCAELSDQRVTFNKKRDTLTLLQLVHKNSPDQLKELVEYVRGLVSAVIK
ncbi:ATP-dependent nuclease [Sandaracinobacteroides saxicola]|uniref:AAA family ATPase n=1 Tax=Sandaracinobacteroides saxicola TaxID=2759707 RepID=A0A7G5IGM6_9SPHN|nr:AAA family ATPase [Sandaracinobacteroides saxicola]QMW22518.1 AAA family ATPase [Sandaracinobacteroides saxicola]